ncbi:AAA family ATPase [Neisseria gonorrhoeae]|uniref:AAA family ATPase n=1 Tax=Neisseria gonorrhoeae TaxID=485 RepID=UPI001FD711EF|nr:AAA family ATPase [Neisseria gonorrhoeae]
MTDLFVREPDAPLAERLRPHTLDDVIGQQHLIGEGKPLRVAVEGGKPHSMLLWGPPGVGKTTLARILAQSFNAQFLPVSAVFSGVKDIRGQSIRLKSLCSRDARRFCLSMKSTASTRRSRTRFCRMSKAVC